MGRKAHHLLSPRGILLRGERHDLLARGRLERSCHHCHRCDLPSVAMMAVKAPSSPRALESAKDHFYRFWVETQGNPPHTPHEAAFPAFTASAPKAVHPTSVLSGSAAEDNEGAFQVTFRGKIPLAASRHDAPSIPIGPCPNGVIEGTSTPFMCGNVANIPRRGSHLHSLRGL